MSSSLPIHAPHCVVGVIGGGQLGRMIALAAQRGQWGSIPFLLLFFGGFGYVAAGSLMVFILALGYYITPALLGGQSGGVVVG